VKKDDEIRRTNFSFSFLTIWVSDGQTFLIYLHCSSIKVECHVRLIQIPVSNSNAIEAVSNVGMVVGIVTLLYFESTLMEMKCFFVFFLCLENTTNVVETCSKLRMTTSVTISKSV
jgi:hypothetical protein